MLTTYPTQGSEKQQPFPACTGDKQGTHEHRANTGDSEGEVTPGRQLAATCQSIHTHSYT